MARQQKGKPNRGRRKDQPRPARRSPTRIQPAVHTLLRLQHTLGNRSLQRLLAPGPVRLQLKEQPGSAPAASEPALQPQAAGAEPAAQAPSGEKAESRPALIVEDNATDLQPGQMKKNAFLQKAYQTACKATQDIPSTVGHMTRDCPYLDLVFSFMRRRSASYIEATLRRFAPGLPATASARAYLPFLAERVRQSTEVWIRTGKIRGLPGGIPSPLLFGMADFGIGSSLFEAGSVLFKGKGGGAHAAGSAQSVRARLGPGRPLDTSVSSRMGAALGADFSEVRLHTGSKASSLASGLNARAFTVGRDVAFGAGEYQPGSPVGDAIIAHELAHVVQQGGHSPAGPMSEGAAYDSLEEDADSSALQAVASLWSRSKGQMAGIARNAKPLLRSGLRLQSCKEKGKKTAKTGPSLDDYKDAKKPEHDPSKLSDAVIEATAEYKKYMDPKSDFQAKLKVTKEEARLACRLMLRHMREGNAVDWKKEAEGFVLRARSQLGVAKEAEKLTGKLKWVPFTSTQAVADPSKLESEFGKWTLAGGPEPTDVSKMNCWEMILFAAYKEKFTSFKKLKKTYEKAADDVKTGKTSSVGFALKNYLRAGAVYVFKPGDPKSPEPLPGDIVVFDEARNHAVISLGTKKAGKHEVMSLWIPPGYTRKVEKTTIEDLLPSTKGPVRFWGAAW